MHFSNKGARRAGCDGERSCEGVFSEPAADDGCSGIPAVSSERPAFVELARQQARNVEPCAAPRAYGRDRLGAWQLILLSQPLGAIRWGILVPAIAAGGRAETVRTHAQEYVRTHGRRPEGAYVLQDIYTGSPFTVVYSDAD